MKIGFIGCGKIAHFHAEVLQSLGAEIVSLSYRSDREKARIFSDKFGVRRIFNDWKEMISTANPDALWVLADWEKIDEMLLPVLEFNLPVFFEKPVALSSEKIEMAIESYKSGISSVQVGYNRRFYSVVRQLKDELSGKRIIAAEIFIPESVNLSDKNLVRYRTLQNSSHIIDLLYFLFEGFDPVIEQVKTFSEAGFITPGYTATLSSGIGFSLYISSVFNSPLNTSIRIYTDDETIYELKPVEKLCVYKGFEVIEPGENQPVRLYNPKIIREIYEPVDKYKPGFLEQARSFITETFNNHNESLPNLQTSLKVTRLIEELTLTKKIRNG